MTTTQARSVGVLGRGEAAPTALTGRSVRRRLRGSRVDFVSARPTELLVSLGRRGAVVLRAEPDAAGGALLRLGIDRAPGAATGSRLYPELSGRRIVRVRGGGDRVELHFGDGSTLELRPVVNLDGCRMATVRRRTRRNRGSALLDRSLGRLLQPRPPEARGPRPSAGAGTY